MPAYIVVIFLLTSIAFDTSGLAAAQPPTEANGQTLWARFSDVSGLEAGAPVQVKGYTVGHVLRIELENNGADLAAITFKVWIQISEDLPLPAVRTRLRMQQIIPTQAVTLVLFDTGVNAVNEGPIPDQGEIPVAAVERPPNLAERGERLLANLEALLPQAGDAPESAGSDLKARLLQTLDGVDRAVALFTSLAESGDLPERGRRILDETEAKIDALTDTLAADLSYASGELRSLASRLTALLGDVDLALSADPDAADTLLQEGGNTVAALVWQLNDAARRLNQQMALLATEGDSILVAILEDISTVIKASNNLLRSLGGVVESVKPLTAGDSTASMRRSIDSLEFILQRLATDVDIILNNLSGTTWNLNELLRELRQDPSSVLWGQPRRE